MKVYKLDKISSSKIRVTELQALKRYAKDFALTLFQEEDVFLTGGARSDKVSALNLKQSNWSQAPSLNKVRSYHSCCSINGSLYVCGGYEVNSIEKYKVGVDTAWAIIAEDELINRRYAAIAVMNESSFAVFGGRTGFSNTNNGYLFNVNTREVKPNLGSANDLAFECHSEVHRITKQKFVVLGQGSDFNLHKVELYTNKSCSYFEARSIANYGHWRNE